MKILQYATKITFNDELNIFIGENGSGKSTILEVINFLFRKVLFRAYETNWEQFNKRDSMQSSQKKQLLNLVANHQSYSEFRLEKNWNTENQESKIKLVISLDEIDKKNINYLISIMPKLKEIATDYSHTSLPGLNKNYETEYTVDISLNQPDNFLVTSSPEDAGYLYLVHYNFFKKIIALYNAEKDDKIEPLYETFTLISGYRNYHQFASTISLQQSEAKIQIEDIYKREHSHSVNVAEENEPRVFRFIKLKIAQEHFQAIIGEKNNVPDIPHLNSRIKFLINSAKTSEYN